MAESVKAPVRNMRASLPGNTTVTVDRLPVSSFSSVEYFISLSATPQSKQKVLKLIVFLVGGKLRTTISGKSGDPISIRLDAFFADTFAEVRISNDEAFALSFLAARTLL